MPSVRHLRANGFVQSKALALFFCKGQYTAPTAHHAALNERTFSRWGGGLSSLVLKAVEEAGRWRVELAWPNRPDVTSATSNPQEEAEQWIEEHCWLTDQALEPMLLKGKKLMENKEPLIERPARNASNDWKCHALAC
jgi:hypothetical protein